MNKIVAGLGLFLLLVGLAMTVVISIIEDWVRVGIQGLAECDVESDGVKGQPAKLGSLGLYSATFNPECANGTSVTKYNNFEYTETSTTEFWPLFPAQNSYGGLFGKDLEFKDCESFYAEGSPARAVAASYPFDLAEAGLTANYGELTEGVFEILAGLDGAVAKLWAGQLEENGATLVSTLQGQVTGLVKALVGADIVCGGTQQLAQTGGSMALNADLGGDYSGYDTDLFVAQPVKVAHLAMYFNLTSLGDTATAGAVGTTLCLAAKSQDATLICDVTTVPGYVADFGAGINILQFMLSASKTGYPTFPDYVSPQAPNGYQNPASTLAAGDTVALPLGFYLFGGIAGFDASNTNSSITNSFVNYDFSNTIPFIRAVQYAVHLGVASKVPGFPAVSRAVVEGASAAAAAALASLDSATNLLGLCLSNAKTSFESCKAVFAEVPRASVNDEWTLCTVASASPALAPAVAGAKAYVGNVINATAKCSPMVLFKTVAIALGAGADIDVDPALAPFVPVLVTILEECAKGDLAWNETSSTRGSCQNQFVNPEQATITNAEYAGVPEKWLERSPYCFAVFKENPAATCATFVDFIATQEALASVYAIMQGCLQFSISSLSQCKAVTVNTVSTSVFSLVVSANTTEGFVAACKEDEEDARRIKLAQVLIPAALGVEGVALLLALALIASGKTPLAFVACLLACAGTALSCSALLLVRGAPVYANVGEEVAVGEAKYVGGLANLLGLFAIALPALGGLMLAFSTCCNKEEDEDQLTSKVDATY